MLGYLRKRLARTGGFGIKKKLYYLSYGGREGGVGGKECIYIFQIFRNISRMIGTQLCSFNFIVY